MKTGIDTEALVEQFAQASAKQGDVLRKAVSDATVRALQGRELTLQNIRSVLKTITQAASTGLARNNTAPAVDVEALLSKALAGMDNALLKAVEANRRALQQFVEQGLNLQDGPLKEAVGNLEKMEDVFFSTVRKATQAGGGQLQGPWENVLRGMQSNGSQTGVQASEAVEKLMSQTQSALRANRAAAMRAAGAMMNSYSTLVSGILIGMSEALQRQPAAPGNGDSGSVEQQGGSGGTTDGSGAAESGSSRGAAKGG